MNRHVMVFATIALLSGSASSGEVMPAIRNAGFEEGTPGMPPAGWTLREASRKAGFQAIASARDPREGPQCFELATNSMPPGFGQYGLVTQSLPADSLRGKRVRFKASARAEFPASVMGAGLFARVLRPDLRPGHWCEMTEEPIRAREWRDYAVVLDVAPDAEQLQIGFMLSTLGKAWFDAASLEVVGAAGVGNDPTRPLEDRGLENLVALTRLLGYVQYFHPSDESAAADWGRVAIESIHVVEPATTADELADRLTQVFGPLAPALQVFPTGHPPKAQPDLAGPGKRIIAWRHMGVAANRVHGFFRSDRVVDRALAGGALFSVSPEPLDRPESLFETKLGGGVSCRMPVTLYADERGTLPRAERQPLPPIKPADFPPTGDDRATRLADVMLTWNLFQHFYPYFDVVPVDWPRVLCESLGKAATDEDAARFHDTLKRLVALIEDSHGTVRAGSGCFVPDGALPLAWDWIEDRLVIVPAEPGAGGPVRPGDVVRSIDGVPAAQAIERAERLVSGATPQFRRYRALQDLRNGPAGQTVALEIESAVGAPRVVKLQREAHDDSPLRGPSLRERRLPRMTEVEPGVLYVDLDRYTSTEFRAEVMPKMQAAKGIVFDVRGYPTVGADLLEVIAKRPIKSDDFSQLITRYPDRQRIEYQGGGWSLPPLNPHLEAKVAFLSDGRAVSYAETFLSLVANHALGPIVGGPTAGSNGNVNLMFLPGGYRISFTGLRTIRLDGSRFHGVGVLPTVPVRRSIRAVADGRDEVLDKAIALVRPAA